MVSIPTRRLTFCSVSHRALWVCGISWRVAWPRTSSHPSPVSMLSGRTSNVNDISTEKGRLGSCGEHSECSLLFWQTSTHSLISSSGVDYLANNAVGPGRQRCSHAWASHQIHPPEIALEGTLGSLYDRTSNTRMTGPVLTYILQCQD